MNQKKIFLLGPTASGKTDLTKSCYDTFPIEIISVDSAQIYKDLNIGTAKPSEQELEGEKVTLFFRGYDDVFQCA